MFRSLPIGTFTRHVLVMLSGTALGQLVGLLFAPLLTRIYTPESFGVLGAFSALALVLSVLAALRYDMALAIAEKPGNVLGLCVAALVGVFLAGLALVSLLPLDWFGVLAPYRFALPFGVAGIGAYHVIVYYATRHSAYRAIAGTKLYQGVAGPGSQVLLGLAGSGPWGLVAGFVIGHACGIGGLCTKLRAAIREDMRNVSWRGMADAARRYKRFPLLSSWSGLMEAAGGTGFLLVLAPMYYSSAVAGFIFLVDRLVGRPLLMVSTSILQVYVGDVARSLASDVRGVHARFVQVARAQAVIAAAWLLAVNIAAPFCFAPVFGEVWGEAVSYLHILSIAYFPQMLMHPLVHTLQLIERQHIAAYWEAARLVLVTGVFIGCYALGMPILATLFYYSIAQAVMYVTLFFMMYHTTRTLQKK